MRIAYAMHVRTVGEAVEASFRDVDGTTVLAPNARQAHREAKERLVERLHETVREREDLPTPSKGRQAELVAPPLLVAAKLALYQTMRDQNVSNVELAHRLGLVEGSVRRLVDPNHRSHIETVETALAHMGKRLVLEMWPRAELDQRPHRQRPRRYAR